MSTDESSEVEVAFECEVCARQDALLTQAVAHGVKLTLCVAENSQCRCTQWFWTCLANQGDRVCAVGRGHTQEEATCAALRELGVIV